MPKTKTNNKFKNTPVCVLCKSNEDDELHLGKFFHTKELSVHNFCMLFASDLSQNGKNDNDGFAGFLPKDIKKEVIRGRRLRCSFCKISGATIGCCVPACKKVFHLNCGQKHNSLHLFFDSFLSYCAVHKAKPIYPEGESLTKEFICSICCDTVYLKDYDRTIWTSCCKNGWFHKLCVQRQALTSGYFFRCPLCNNTEQFQKQMLHHGIYIPQQDAAWELEENAFQELLIRHEQCDAKNCLCPKGRKYHTKAKTSQWRLILCEDCGSQGRHVGCEESIKPGGSWKCLFCVEISQKMQEKKMSECLNGRVKKANTNCKPRALQARYNMRSHRSSRNNATAKGSEGTLKHTGNSEPLNVQSETEELRDINVEPPQFTESSDVEHENSFDLFADVATSVHENDFEFSPYKSEILYPGNISANELPCSSLNCNALSECKGLKDLSMANSSDSPSLHADKSRDVEHEIPKTPPVKNGMYLLHADIDNTLVKAKDYNLTTAPSYSVDREHCASQNATTVQVLHKEHSRNKELREITAVEVHLENFSFSPHNLKNTYKMHRKHSKRLCDEDNKLPKKQKLNNPSGQSCSSVTILNLVPDKRQTAGMEHKHFANPGSKTVNEVLSPALSSGAVVCHSQKISNERDNNETLDAENVGNCKPSVVTKIHDGVHNGERDHREPLVKLITVHNRLAKKTVKSGHSETSVNSAQGSDNHLTSENKSVKKQKLNVLSKKNYGTALRCKDNYRCIKALFGGPCKCCEDKLKIAKELSTKSSSKKCSRHCRPHYNIECIGKRSEETAAKSKHSCNRPKGYVVNFWRPSKQMSTISETEENLSVKPQVIHLQNVSQ